MTMERRQFLAMACLFAAGCGRSERTAAPAPQQTPRTKITFVTDWKAQAEHGGFYQALVDGTYKKHGLDVTILPGGPNANHRLSLIAGRIEFYMSANTLQAFDAVSQNIPTVSVAAIFQKEPQVLIAHPGSIPSRDFTVRFPAFAMTDYPFTCRPIERAEPSTIFIAASMVVAFKSFILASAISLT